MSRTRRWRDGSCQALPPKAHKQLPILRTALLPHQAKHAIGSNLELRNKAA
jgi:hypothetical protein